MWYNIREVIFMFDYEKLEKELNTVTINLLKSFKSSYEALLSLSKQKLLTKMIEEENVVAFEDNKNTTVQVIIPSSIPKKHLKDDNYKNSLEINFILIELLKKFITFSLPEKDCLILGNSELNKQLRDDLQTGFVYYIANEFCMKNNLNCPECENTFSLEFINFLKENIQGFSRLKEKVFSLEYSFFCEKFYEQTGEDILDLYEIFVNNNLIANKGR